METYDSQYSADENDDSLQVISITDSKKQLADEWYSITNQLKAQKEKLKDKRRSRHQLFEQQKKQKVKDRAAKRKSSDDESAADDFEGQKSVNEVKTKRVKFEDDSNLTTEPKELDTDLPADDVSEDDDITNQRSDDFIPFNNAEGRVKPVYIGDYFKVNTALEKAMEFKRKHLFGSHVHRQSMSKHLVIAEKRRARYPKAATTAH